MIGKKNFFKKNKFSFLIVSCIIIDKKKKKVKDEGVLLYLSLQDTIHWNFFSSLFFFQSMLFLKKQLLFNIKFIF